MWNGCFWKELIDFFFYFSCNTVKYRVFEQSLPWAKCCKPPFQCIICVWYLTCISRQIFIILLFSFEEWGFVQIETVENQDCRRLQNKDCWKFRLSKCLLQILKSRFWLAFQYHHLKKVQKSEGKSLWIKGKYN